LPVCRAVVFASLVPDPLDPHCPPAFREAVALLLGKDEHTKQDPYKPYAYPFHPELIDVFRVRWASHHDFQRTRGALRLLAAIVSDLWKRQRSLPGSNLLIHSGEVNFANLDALSGQLKRLYGNGYDAVITADVAGSSSNAFKIDGNNPEYGHHSLTQAIASVILIIPLGATAPTKVFRCRNSNCNSWHRKVLTTIV